MKANISPAATSEVKRLPRRVVMLGVTPHGHKNILMLIDDDVLS